MYRVERKLIVSGFAHWPKYLRSYSVRPPPPTTMTSTGEGGSSNPSTFTDSRRARDRAGAREGFRGDVPPAPPGEGVAWSVRLARSGKEGTDRIVGVEPHLDSASTGTRRSLAGPGEFRRCARFLSLLSGGGLVSRL
jgi:hypothetical protein